MPKLFVVSDTHSFFQEFYDALQAAGFDQNNHEHWLIHCGDIFDRGGQSVDMLRFIMSLKNRVLIRGNHEDLLEECCNREFPYSYDKSNGTVRTIMDLGRWISQPGSSFDFQECCMNTIAATKPLFNELKNYFETENYIFVHSFYPYEMGEDWREAKQNQWANARWGNPFICASVHGNNTGKTIVHGHWHNSEFWCVSGKCSGEFANDAIFDIARHPSENPTCIGLDACTAYTKKVNVLVIEDKFLQANGV